MKPISPDQSLKVLESSGFGILVHQTMNFGNREILASCGIVGNVLSATPGVEVGSTCIDGQQIESRSSFRFAFMGGEIGGDVLPGERKENFGDEMNRRRRPLDIE